MKRVSRLLVLVLVASMCVALPVFDATPASAQGGNSVDVSYRASDDAVMQLEQYAVGRFERRFARGPLYVTFNSGIGATKTFTLQMIDSLKFGPGPAITNAAGFKLSVAPAVGGDRRFEFFASTGSLSTSQTDSSALTAGKSVIVITSENTYSVCSDCITGLASFRVSLFPGQAVALVDNNALGEITPDILRDRSLPSVMATLDGMLRENDRTVGSAKGVTHTALSLNREVERIVRVLTAETSPTATTANVLFEQVLKLRRPQYYWDVVSAGSRNAHGADLPKAFTTLSELAETKMVAYLKRVLKQNESASLTEQEYQGRIADTRQLLDLQVIIGAIGPPSDALTKILSELVPAITKSAVMPGGFADPNTQPPSSLGTDPRSSEFCQSARRLIDVGSLAQAIGDSKFSVQTQLEDVQTRLWKKVDEEFPDLNDNDIRAKLDQFKAAIECGGPLDLVTGSPPGNKTKLEEAKKKLDEILGAPQGACLTAYVYDLRSQRNARSPLDRTAGLLAIVSPGQTKRLSAVPYASTVTIDDQAISTLRTPGIGKEARTSSGQLAWRAVRYEDGRLYIEIFIIGIETATAKPLPKKIKVNETLCYNIDLSSIGAVPFTDPSATPAPGGTSGPGTPPPPACPPAAQAAPAVVRLAVFQQTRATECAIKLGDNTIQTVADAQALVAKGKTALGNMVDLLGNLPDLPPTPTAKLGALRKPIGNGDALLRTFGTNRSRALTFAEQNALVLWYDDAVSGVDETDALLRSEATRRARVAEEQMRARIVRETSAAKRRLKEERRRAFRANNFSQLQELGEGFEAVESLTSGIETATTITDVGAFVGIDPFNINGRLNALGKIVEPFGKAAEKLKQATDAITVAFAVFGPNDPGATEFASYSEALDTFSKFNGFLPWSKTVLLTVGELDEVFSSTQSLLATLEEAAIAGTNRFEFERGNWRRVDWRLEPGGFDMAVFMRRVRLANRASELPNVPVDSVAAFFVAKREAFDAGVPGGPMPIVRGELDPRQFKNWVFSNREDIWTLLYGGRVLPTRVTSRP